MIKILEENNFNEVIKEGTWLVDFSAVWCGPCRMLEPVLEEISKEANVLKVDIDKFQELTASFGIMSVPTLIVFENGKQKTISVGYKSKSEVEELLK